MDGQRDRDWYLGDRDRRRRDNDWVRLNRRLGELFDQLPVR